MLKELAGIWPRLEECLAAQGSPLPLTALGLCRVVTRHERLADPDELRSRLSACWREDPPHAAWLRCQSSLHVHVENEPLRPEEWEGLPLYGECAWEHRSVRFRPDGHGSIALVQVEEGNGPEVLVEERRVRAAREELGRAVYRVYWGVDGNGLVRLHAWRLLRFERGGSGW